MVFWQNIRISITPTPSRWKHWPMVREANRLIEAYARTDLRLHFIDMTDAILGPDGKPNRDLFRIDRLHPNQAGYAKWTATIKPILQADLRSLDCRAILPIPDIAGLI